MSTTRTRFIVLAAVLVATPVVAFVGLYGYCYYQDALRSVDSLSVTGSAITDAGIARLQSEMPNVHVSTREQLRTANH